MASRGKKLRTLFEDKLLYYIDGTNENTEKRVHSLLIRQSSSSSQRNMRRREKEQRMRRGKSYGLVQCFSTWVPRNPEVPPK
jgi:hypothetical protein